MGLEPKKQEEYYEKYWNKIERYTNYSARSFVIDYLSVKQLSTPAMNKIYFTFKYYLEEKRMEVLELLVDLLHYAKLYKILLSGKTSNRKLNSSIYRLNKLETTITRPFFLEVLSLNDKGVLKEDEVERVFYIIESYLFRRTICDLPTNMLNKILLTLHKDIVKYDGTNDDYINKLSYTLLAKKERARFLDDSEFAEAIQEKPIYLMNSKNKVYLLERFENFGTIEDKNVWEHIVNGDYTIEHICHNTLPLHGLNLLEVTIR